MSVEQKLTLKGTWTAIKAVMRELDDIATIFDVDVIPEGEEP